MEQRLSLVTLGVRDLPISAAFYRALGWTARGAPEDSDVIFFQAAGIVLALWSREALAEDSCVVDSGGWGGITLAQNVRSPSEVDAVLASAEAPGRGSGERVRPPPGVATPASSATRTAIPGRSRTTPS